MSQVDIKDRLTLPDQVNPTRGLIATGVVGLIASAIGYFLNHDQFFFSYLTSWVFYMSIALAALFFVMLQHVTRSSWSVVVRRIPETLSYNILPWAIFLIPVLFGMHTLYHWTHHSAVAHDPVLQGKTPWLNSTFFVVRQFIYFGIWGFLSYRLHKNSVKMDETGDWGLQTLLRRTSGPGIFIYAITVGFASIDWLMTLDPHWYSTIFAVYFFSMSIQAFFAVMILMVFYLQSKGVLQQTINRSHIYDLGILLFGFSIFYAYIAFCQYLLIYYANLPEETVWFHHRLEHGYQGIALALLIGRFLIPFLVLLPKKMKSIKNVVIPISILILAVHFFELSWLVMPLLKEHGYSINWMDVTTFLGLGGIFFGLFFNKFRKHKIIPENDPLLEQSVNKHL